MSLIYRKVKQLKSIFLNEAERNFLKLNHIKHQSKNNEQIVLIEISIDLYYLVHFYFLLKEKPFRNKKIVGLWMNPGNLKRSGIRGAIAFLFQYLIQYFVKLKWKKLWKCLGVSEVIELSNDFKDNIFIRNTNFIKTYSKVKNKKDILKIKYKGVKVGDLIYDHYLRYNGNVSFNIQDTYAIKRLLNIVEGSNENLESFYFKNRKKIDYYIPQKAIYLTGFALRFFLSKNIKTVGGREYTKYVKKFTKTHYFEGSKNEDLAKKFKKLKNKKKKIQLAKKFLKEKFDGKINTENRDMKKSPYDKKKLLKINKKFDVIIFLPDFSDAPHCYGNLVFDDFSDWIDETLKFLKLKNLSVAVKEHPHSWVFSSVKFTETLKKKYSNLIWLNRNISNFKIFQNKPRFGISPFGTVLHELAYHKIIPIAAGPNPHMAYNFVFTPNNKKHYFSLINQAIHSKLKLKKNFKEKIAECYYMFFLNNDDYIKNRSRELNLQNYLPAVGEETVEILEKFNKGHFKK